MDGMKLAKYDFRSKQDYIYKTNKIKEIVGASEIITYAYNDFFEALKEEGIVVDNGYAIDGKCPAGKACAFVNGSAPRYINNPDMEFTPDFPDGLDGKIIYIGGGNLYMLWKDETMACGASSILCKMLREKAYSLSAVCGMTEYSGNYSDDMVKLDKNFERFKVSVPPFLPTAMLPFSEIDRRTSLPIAHKYGEKGSYQYLVGKESISEESFLKRRQYRATHGDIREYLDDMVTEKGRESLLAVIYIDGNNMGVRVKNKMEPKDASGKGQPVTDYVESVKRIREFSNFIQDSFVTNTRNAIDDRIYGLLKRKQYGNNEVTPDQMIELRREADRRVRWIVSGGDEITLICNARDVLEVLDAYFNELVKDNKKDEPENNNTACAGVAIFHSHFPFSKAYEIAEECCENAKKKNRRNDSNNCLVDFQYIYAGVTGDLDSMRKQDGMKMARPYLVFGNAADIPSLTVDFKMRAERLKKIGRANIKNLASKLFGSDEEYRFEIERLNSLYDSAELKSNYSEDRKYLLDIAQFYDVWFSKEVK